METASVARLLSVVSCTSAQPLADFLDSPAQLFRAEAKTAKSFVPRTVKSLCADLDLMVAG